MRVRYRIDGKKIICILGTLFYVYYILVRNPSFDYDGWMAGVHYNGNPIAYAITFYLFALFIFSGFGKTERYINGYGVLEVIRNRKRKKVIDYVLFRQAICYIEVLGIMCFLYFCGAGLLNKKAVFEIKEFICSILLFSIVNFSLLLWQSFFEIMFDSRIAILFVMSFICLHLALGDIFARYGVNPYWNLLCYSNLALVVRRKSLGLYNGVILLTVGLLCVGQIFAVNYAYGRKDIFGDRK